MRALGKGLVVILALVGAIASIQVLRGQAAAPLAAGNFLHVGIVVKDIARTAQMFSDVYGVTPPAPRVFDNVKTLRLPAGASGNQAAKAKLVQFTVGNVRVELIEPTEGATPWQEHLDKYGQSVHHLSFGVPDIEQSLLGDGRTGKHVVQVRRHAGSLGLHRRARASADSNSSSPGAVCSGQIACHGSHWHDDPLCTHEAWIRRTAVGVCFRRLGAGSRLVQLLVDPPAAVAVTRRH